LTRRVAYLGPQGTYTEEAALRFAPDAELVAFPTVRHVAAAVENGEVAEAVAPIENSLQGSVNEILDFLIAARQTVIKGEVLLPVVHSLMAKPGTRLADVTTVRAHPQALGQCGEYLHRHLPLARQVATLSNAAAAAEVRAGPAGEAAIGPRRAAAIYGLEVLAEGVQDSATNVTRFVVLARQDHPPTGRDRTSFCYDVKDMPGALYQTLRPIAERKINLTKIESRPFGDRLGRYIFLVDVDGHRTDPDVAAALSELKGMTLMLKVLGSYPRAEMP
jgi:prephenate dehydratase